MFARERKSLLVKRTNGAFIVGDLLPYLGRTDQALPILFLSEVFELAISGRLSGSNSHVIAVDQAVKKVKKIGG